MIASRRKEEDQEEVSHSALRISLPTNSFKSGAFLKN